MNKYCLAWRETGSCQFGESCAFSHGENQFTEYDTKEKMKSILDDIHKSRAREKAEMMKNEIEAGLRCRVCHENMPCAHIKCVSILIYYCRHCFSMKWNL